MVIYRNFDSQKEANRAMHGFVSAATIRAEDASASRSLSGKLTDNLRITRKPARGRAVETTTAMEAGAVVLAESPICWWVDPACQDFVCAHCLETFDAAAPGVPARCSSCRQVRWCSARCHAEDCHHSFVCSMLNSANSLGDSEEDADATSLVHFVAHAIRLQRTSPAEFNQLWNIMLGTHVTLSEADEIVCRRVAAVLQGTSRHDDPYLHLSLIRELCKKDKTANFAVMLPPKKDNSAAEPEGLLERRARGYATYPYMSLVNHSCLPTVARFDHFDRARNTELTSAAARDAAPKRVCVGSLASASDADLLRPPHSISMRLVAMHGLPARSELFLTYMPPADEPHIRRERLRSEYGFTCHCHRCVVEFAAEDEANEATSPNESVHPASLASAEQAGVSTTYIGLYLLKHVCPDCGGTLAPILQSTTCICNRCGGQQTDAEFMERAEVFFAES